MADSKQIYELLPKVARAVGAIGKNRKNQGQNYNFRGIEDVMNHVHPELTEHGVTVVPRVSKVTREHGTSKSGGMMTTTVLEVTYTFYAPDGSHVEAIVVGEGMDSGDKSCNKALSAAFKYALGQVLSIPFEAVDSEEDNPEPAPQKQSKPANGTATISKAQGGELSKLIEKAGIPAKDFFAEYQITRLGEMPAIHFTAAKIRLEKYIASKNNGAANQKPQPQGAN